MGSSKILVTGATGATGGTAIKTLLELKVPGRALVHKTDARSEQLRAQGVEIVQGDLFDFEAVSEALKGITGAYFVFPIQVPGILEATAFFAQAAIEQGVSAIVNMSQISARRIAKSHVGHVAQDCLDGVFSGTNDLVEKLTGQKPLEMMDYIVKNKARFS
jgi:NAD(P)H dehydrogenase (quinone)